MDIFRYIRYSSVYKHLQEFGISAWHTSFFLANEEKTTTNNLATNLVFVGSWQILPLRRAYMRAETLWHRGLRRLRDSRTEAERIDMAAASSSTSRSLLLQLVVDDAGRRRPLRAPDRRLHPREASGVAVRGAEALRRAPPRALPALRRRPPHVGLRLRQAHQRHPPRRRAHRDQSRRNRRSTRN